jgi:hypothetical protein
MQQKRHTLRHSSVVVTLFLNYAVIRGIERAQRHQHGSTRIKCILPVAKIILGHESITCLQGTDYHYENEKKTDKLNLDCGG